jgi:hypothetical protein
MRVDERSGVPRPYENAGVCYVLYCTPPDRPSHRLPNGRGLERPRPCSLRDTAPPPQSAIVGVVPKVAHAARVLRLRRLSSAAEPMHIETARLVEFLSHEPRYATSTLSLRAKPRRLVKA